MRERITRRTVLTVVLWALGLLCILAPFPALAQDGPPVEEQIASPFQPDEILIPPFVPGSVLVGVRGQAAADVAAAVSVSGAASVPAWEGIEVLAVEPLDINFSAVTAAGGEAGEAITGFELTVPVGTEWAAVDALLTRGDVAFAEPNWLAHIAAGEPDTLDASEESNKTEEVDGAMVETPYIVNDTLYPEQWYLQRIGMSRAWALALQESGGNLGTIRIFVIDTGVDFVHPDLAGRLAPGFNYVPLVPGQPPPTDDHGHGTHVTGLIAAAANGTGMVGTGLAVEITPFKALGANGSGPIAVIAEAINDAVEQGADIINLSLETEFNSTVLRSAVQEAIDAGVLVIAAAGNRGATDDPTKVPPVKGVSYPAAYPMVLAVGATSYFDVPTYYSNQGADLDIVAPGGLTTHSILSTWTTRKGCTTFRQVNGGVYCSIEGTSMAAGIVSGVAALIMGLRPDLDAAEVQEILLESAAPIDGTSEEVGRGRLDAAAAVRSALAARLLFAEEGMVAKAVEGSAPFTITLPLTNPSLTPVSVEMTPTITTTWYSLVGPRSGDVTYDNPLEVQFVVTPTAVGIGAFQSSVRMTVTVEGEGTSIYFVDTRLNVYPDMVGDARLFVPWAGTGGIEFQWVEPPFTGRTSYTLANNGSIVVDLPFTMTVEQGEDQREYTDLRIFADGFAVASASASSENLPNTCLDNQVWPSFSVYGWWSDLSLAANSALSTFQPDANRFVVEYDRFVSEGSSDPDDRVSFQIVLHRNGQVELNYGETPEHAPSNVTVGASVQDGRFYNQLTCYIAGTTKLGKVPQDFQTFILTTQELY